MDGQNFLNDFLENGKNQGMACDDAYETGFATLTDKEGHPYVAHLVSGTGKEGKKDEKKGEKKPESEKKTEEKSEKKGAEIIELHPEKSKKYKVNWHGKEDVFNTREDLENEKKGYEESIKYCKKELSDFEKRKKANEEKLKQADNALNFWKDYNIRQDKNLTPQQFFDKNRSAYKITNKDDLREIAFNANEDDTSVKTRISVYKEKKNMAQNDIKNNEEEITHYQDLVESYSDYVNAINKSLSMAQDSALDAYFDNINLF